MTHGRTQHNEVHYRKMADEFRKNLKLVAGNKLGEIVYSNLVDTFAGDVSEHKTAMALAVRECSSRCYPTNAQAMIESLKLSYNGTVPGDDDFLVEDTGPQPSHPITSHHITSHHITSHPIPSSG